MKRRSALIVGFAVLASLAFHVVPLWLEPTWAPPMTLAVLLMLDAACIALLVRSFASVGALAAFAGLWGLMWLLKAHVLVVAPSVLLYSGLALAFLVTLRPGSPDLISRIALKRHGNALTPRALRYFRGLTAIWAALFGLLAAASIALSQLSSFAAWSLFVNVLTWPLMGVFFLAEWAVRRMFFRDLPPDTPLDVISAILAYRPHAPARP